MAREVVDCCWIARLIMEGRGAGNCLLQDT